MEYVLTLAIPFCALAAVCPPRDAVPLSAAEIHYGDCLDLQHLPLTGRGDPVRAPMRPAGETVWPCGGKAR